LYVPASVDPEVDAGSHYDVYDEVPINQSGEPLFEDEFSTF